MAREILIVDDEADIRMLITGILADEGYETREASNSTETLDEIRKRRPDLVILDVWLQNSELDGIEVLTKLKRVDPTLPVVIISGHGTIGTAVQAIKLGAYDFIDRTTLRIVELTVAKSLSSVYTFSLESTCISVDLPTLV